MPTHVLDEIIERLRLVGEIVLRYACVRVEGAPGMLVIVANPWGNYLRVAWYEGVERAGRQLAFVPYTRHGLMQVCRDFEAEVMALPARVRWFGQGEPWERRADAILARLAQVHAACGEADYGLARVTGVGVIGRCGLDEYRVIERRHAVRLIGPDRAAINVALARHPHGWCLDIERENLHTSAPAPHLVWLSGVRDTADAPLDQASGYRAYLRALLAAGFSPASDEAVA